MHWKEKLKTKVKKEINATIVSMHGMQYVYILIYDVFKFVWKFLVVFYVSNTVFFIFSLTMAPIEKERRGYELRQNYRFEMQRSTCSICSILPFTTKVCG